MNLMEAKKQKKNKMKFDKYIAIFRIGKTNKKAYLTNFIGNIMYMPINLLILYIVWKSIFISLNINSLNGFTFNELFSYYFIIKLINYSTGYFNGLSYTIWSDITKGTISKFLCRPINYIKYNLSYGIGFIVHNLIVCIPILIIGSYLLEIKHLSILSIICFIISFILALLITFYLYFFIGILTFWTESIFGIRDLIINIGLIFSGSLVPLEFLPNFIGKCGNILPFNSMLYVPTSIYLNKIDNIIMYKSIGIQIIWAIILYVIVKIVWSKGVRRFEAQGG